MLLSMLFCLFVWVLIGFLTATIALYLDGPCKNDEFLGCCLAGPIAAVWFLIDYLPRMDVMQIYIKYVSGLNPKHK